MNRLCLKDTDQNFLNLGEIAEALNMLDETKEIAFDFGYFSPTWLHSWRGDYSQLAIDYDLDGRTTVGDLMARINEALAGKVFVGWKGGGYRMRDSSLVWVSKPRDANHTAVVGFTAFRHGVIINTAWREDY